MAQLTIQHAFDLAMQHHQAGRLREAEQIYRQILSEQPEHVAAMHFLGVIANRAGRGDVALELIRRAIALNPNYAEAHNNLGNVLKDQGQLDDAITAYRKAVAINRNFAEAYNNLGNALTDKGQVDAALSACRQAIALRPDMPEAHNNLGNALKSKRRFPAAIAAYRQAIALKPNYAQAYSNLANALTDKGDLADAVAACRWAIAIRPDFADAYNNLGNILRDLGQPNEAIAAYRQAVSLRPGFPEAHNNLGGALKNNGQLDDAIAAYRHALTIRPSFPEAYTNLGNALKDSARLEDAIRAFRKALALRPNDAGAHSDLILALQLHPGDDDRAVAQELGRWDRQHAQPLRRFIRSHSNDRSRDRRLRIGYVSPDFRDHVVGRNLLPLFQQHDRRQFEITCYAHVLRADAITRQFQQHADGWRNIVDLSDDQVADQIRQDRIDLLVDLTLHTTNNRLLIFARKPAPVQVTFGGYPGSTGLSTVDYRLSDPYLDPPGMDESVYSEKTIRLPDSFWCYDPLDGREITVNSLPALEASVVTFGYLGAFCKVNEDILALWAKVLRRVANSRLLLLAPRGSHRQATLDRLGQEGIDPSRVEFLPRQSRRDYLELYHRIDLALDSFPYNGHTTSLESFWMGVPLVTLVGRRVVSRAGWCQLSNLGLGELAAQTPEEFVRIAVEMARDLPRLKDLRSTLRQRMEQSPLMNASKFARNIEAAYRLVWRTWCETNSARS